MLLTITYTGQNTADLGYLLYKNPYRPQKFELSLGRAYVFYPEVSDGRTTAALLIELDPVDFARGRVGSRSGGLFDYVNDRPYVSSSFMSTAISRVFGSAMAGRADPLHQELADSALDLAAVVTMLPCRGEPEKLKNVFEPLGYEAAYEVFENDEVFSGRGVGRYVNLTIRGKMRLRDMLNHLYVLIPVFDRQKHYWAGADEVDKLLRHGGGWLEGHPEKGYITGRYLKRRTLVNMAFERLAEADASGEEVARDETAPSENTKDAEEKSEKKLDLNKRRLGSVIAALKSRGAKSVIDIGCGEGNLLSLLLKERQFAKIAGADVSHVALKRAAEKLKLERASESVLERVTLFQSSLTYKDARFSGYDAACVIEVIEHLDIARLVAFERVLFEFAKPPLVVLTTPNKEYNANYESLGEDDFRHGDHRFEWTRAEFRNWADRTAEKYGYAVQFSQIGEIDEICGAPTQMGVFTI
jgi:3' terminal RNA ribose 2'-O-methyltransferase Hen1